MDGLNLVAKRKESRKQRRQRAVVGVPSGIRFERDVLREWHARRELRLGGGEGALSQKSGHYLGGGRRQERLGRLGPGELCKKVIDTDNPAVWSEREAGARVSHDGRGHTHERGGRHPTDLMIEVQVDQF